MVIVDAQVHIWGADTPERPWVPGQAQHAQKPYPVTTEMVLAAMNEAGVHGAVLVPPSWEGDRNDLVLEAARVHPTRFAAMGRIALDAPESQALLTTWKQQPGMKGVRLTFHREHHRRWLFDGTADWFWPEAEKHAIPVMIFAPGKNAEIRAIAAAHPKLKLIVDHMNLRREQDAAAIAAIEDLCALAECANVHVKVSSVPLYSSEPYPYRNLHDPLRRLIGAFGPERSFWGTDITRIWSRATYRQCVTAFTEELTFLSADDLDWVMGRGLLRCLDWPLAVVAR